MIELIHTYWLYFLVGQFPDGPLGGLALTVLLAALALALALPVGLVLGLARVSALRAIRWPVSALVHVVRGIPLLMVIFWAYFFLPSVTGHKTEQFSTMLIALVVFDGVYLAEIVRAGIRGVPRGQFDAVDALGLPFFTGMRHVVLPQALRIVMPPLTSNGINVMKDTALASVVAMPDLLKQATQAQALAANPTPLIGAALLYLALLLPLVRLAGHAEARYRAALR